MDVNDDTPHEAASPPRKPVSRRRVLALGTAAGLVPLLEWSNPPLAGAATPLDPAGARAVLEQGRRALRVSAFDADWHFHRGQLDGAEAPALDDAEWRLVRTPHDWSIEDLPDPTSLDGGATADPTGWVVPADAPSRIGPFDASSTDKGRSQAWTVGGEGWYRKTFQLDEPVTGEQVQVRFDGVYENADVWLNGHHLGFHPYGYTSFVLDLTPHLVPGENVLAVRARNIGETSRWYTGSGIYRHVCLLRSGPVLVREFGVGVSCHDVSERRAVVSVSATVDNRDVRGQHVRARITLVDRDGHAVASATTRTSHLRPGKSDALRVDLPVERPQLWDLDHPYLYTVRTELVIARSVVDSVETSTGIRSIAISAERGFELNGTTVKMRGGNVHHDLGAVGAAALDDAEERRLQIMKDSGFNAVRTSHNPMSPAFLDACDRIGLLVVEEAFDMWDSHKRADDYATYFEEWGERDLTSMVLRDRNHPSVVMWSTGNEIGRPTAAGPNPSVAKYGRRLADLTRELDPSRPVTQGSAMGQAFFFTLPADAPDWDYLDLADTHYQNDLATPSHNSVLPLHEGHPEKALVVGEAWHQEIYDDWKSVTDHSWAIGTFSWTGWDYFGESGAGVPQLFPVDAPPARISIPNLPYPWISSFQGDHDLTGERKPQLAWKRVVWGLSDLEMAVERPAPAGQEQRAVGWSYYDELSSWTWQVAAGTPMTVRVYTSGDQVRLLLDGQEVARRDLTPADKQVTAFTVPYAPGTLEAVATRGGSPLATTRLETVGPAAAIRLTSDRDRLGADPSSLVHITVEIVDAHGRRVPDAVQEVGFDVAGPAGLVGSVNGNPHNVDSFQLPRRHTYHGRVLAVVGRRTAGGQVEVTVTAEGLTRGRITL